MTESIAAGTQSIGGLIVAGGGDHDCPFALGVGYCFAHNGGVAVGSEADVDDLRACVGGLHDAFGEREAVALTLAVRDAHVKDVAGGCDSGKLACLARR
jgi:hypothetical protein